MFAKKKKRAERHIACMGDMFAETGICDNAEIRFPVTELTVEGDHGATIITFAFEGKRIRVTASYDKMLSYSGKGTAFREFMRANKELDNRKKEKWAYWIDTDLQKMVFTEHYKMKRKITKTDRRFKMFIDRIFCNVPQTFDAIQSEIRRGGSMCFGSDVLKNRIPAHSTVSAT